MFRRCTLNIFAAILLFIQFSAYPEDVLGMAKEATVVSTLGKLEISAEQAAQIVKDNFIIPTKYTQMSTGYNDYNNTGTYTLNWNADDQSEGSFNAEVDATTGEIINVNQWDGPFQAAFKLPVLSEEEAEQIAANLIGKLVGKHQTEMRLVKDEPQNFRLSDGQPFTYDFHWIRIVNGIEFPGNGVNVGVSGVDGSIRNYNFNWTRNLVFPEAKNVISLEKARQIFMNTPMIELQYYIPQSIKPQSQEVQRVLLVYQISNCYSGGAINALTGKPVTLDPQEGTYRTMSAVSTVSSDLLTDAASSGTNVLSQAISKTNRISRDDAVDIVKKMVDIPSDLVVHSSNLSPDWQNPNDQVWNLDWSSQPDTTEFRFINARVNAITGDFIGFGMSGPTNSGDKSNPLSRESAGQLAEDFLRHVQADRFKLVKLDAGSFSGGEMPSNIQGFHFVRMVNGLPVTGNGMDIAVDTVAKQVTNYNLNWSEINFPSPSNLISLNQATERFLQARPLALNYSLIYHQNGQQEVQLVYQTNPDNSMFIPGMLDAQTGELVDWYGKPQSQNALSHHYKDIRGNFAEKEISIMGLTGALGEYGDTFHPDEKITVGSLLRAILTAEGNGRDGVLSDNDLLKIAKDRHWIQDDMILDSDLNRANLSKLMIRLINMESSAQIKGIYAVPFNDAMTIQPDSLGYMALAWGLGILKIDGNNVLPDKIVTRAEAAYAIVHTYAAEHPKN